VLTTGSDHAAHLVCSIRASVLLEPRNEGSDGESLGHGTRVGSSTGGSRRSRGISGLGRGSSGDRRGGGRCSRLGRGSGSGGGRSGRSSRRSRSGWLSRGGAIARATAHLEVDARLISLVYGRSVPEPLDDAVTSVGALRADIGHGDVEASPLGVLGHGNGGQCVLVPADEGLADDLVRLDANDRDVGETVVRSTDLNLHGDLLASGVAEDLTGILERNTLALPDTAVWVRALEVLDGTLNIAVLIRILRVEDLVTAGSLEAGAGLTRSGAGDEAVGGNGGDEASSGDDGRVGLHCDCCWVDV
jgi:hypothetical protein